MFYDLPGWVYYLLPVVVFVLIYFATKKDGINFVEKFKPNSSGTPFLDTYTTDFTRMVIDKLLDPVIGREEEIKKLSQILSRRSKNNAILVGPPGVGKTAIVEALAQRIISKEVPEHLQNKRVLALDVAVLMSGTKYRGEFEERAKKIVKEIENSHRSIILFIDEVHSVIQSKGTEGAVNFSDILKPALARGDLQMIGATTTSEYDQYIKTDSSLERRFQPVEVGEPNEEETITILHGVKDKYREYHKVEFTDAAIETAAKLSQKLIKNRKLPDKAIDAIDESAAMIKVSHLHEDVPIVLYKAAVEKYPKVTNIWKQLQKLDSESTKKEDKKIIAKREKLEDELKSKGILTVDSDDIEKVIKNSVK